MQAINQQKDNVCTLHDCVLHAPCRWRRRPASGVASGYSDAVMAFVHPILGGITLLLAIWLMSRGLVVRRGGKPATAARRAHKRWAWWILGLVWASLLTGFGSTILLRPDLELGETWHLALGLVVVGLFTLGGLLTRGFTRDRRLRAVHPWIGILAVLIGIAHAITGIELLP